jgi:hypothetical protein
MVDDAHKKNIATAKEILRQSRRLPAREQLRGLVEKGIIDDRGQLRNAETEQGQGAKNGAVD